MSAAAIELDGIRVVRARRTVLAIDRLVVAPGELLAVLGPNGAGKSTLLKCMTGAIRPNTGTVHMLGQPLARLGAAGLTRLRQRVAHLMQLLAPGSEMPLTLREVVAIGRTGRAGMLRPLRSEDWCAVDAWIERFGLQSLASQPYSVLSGGEQRKSLLAMAMAQEPEILLLDEPTANLDAFWREQIVALLEEMQRQRGLTIVLVCHDLEALPRTTGRVLVLRAGCVLDQGPSASVLTPSRIQDLYGPGLALLAAHGRYALVPQPREDWP